LCRIEKFSKTRTKELLLEIDISEHSGNRDYREIYKLTKM